MPTDNNELRALHDAINNGINNDSMIVITPEIIQMCTKELKPGKDDGDMSFKWDHLIHGGHQLHVVLSTLFTTMLFHGYTPSVLLKSTFVTVFFITFQTSRLKDYNGYKTRQHVC